MQRVGDESAQRLFQSHHELLSDAVAATGGSELQWLGDGLMVAFASTADAVRCAIAMQQAAARQPGERLRIRVGLNVGEVLRQAAGSGSGYFGTPVVMARRLCDRAAAGQILASAAVAHLLAGRAAFSFRDLGALGLKGIAEEVPACEVVYEAEAVTALLARTPFVGREGEVERLRKLLERTRAGRGALAFLVGEPGIGKTRTLEEFCARARAEGATLLWGRSFEGDVETPFGPFAEAIADWAEGQEREGLRERLGPYGAVLAKLCPRLRELLPDLPEPPPLAADAERARLLDAVVQVLLGLAKREPVLLVLDDLHWADAATLALLRHVARFVARGRILLLGAYRDVDLDRQHPLADALGALKREADYERIALRRLERRVVAQLIERLAAQEVPEALVEAIDAETEGNPFFIREVLLHLVEEGRLERAEGRWTSRLPIEELGIPEGVRQVIGRRLSRLSGDANRLLATASGFPGAFRFDVVARSAEVAEAPALDALDEALAAQILRPAGEVDVYDFTHALLRHALYTELSPSRQVRLHRRLAEEMERALGERAAEHAEAIAQQWHRSAALPGAERGVAHCLAAAERAEGAAAHEQAAAALRMALDCLPAGDARRPRVLARLGLALAWGLDPEQAVAVAGEAGRRIAESEGAGPAAEYLADAADAVWAAAYSARAWALAEQGVALAGDRRDLVWARLAIHDLARRDALDPEQPGIPIESAELREAATIVQAGRGWGGAGRVFNATVFSSRADALERAAQEPVILGFWCGEYRRALPLFVDLAGEALARGEVASAAANLALAGRMQVALGDLAAASEHAARASELAARVGNPPFVVMQIEAVPANLVLARGDSPESLLPWFEAAVSRAAVENRWLLAMIKVGAAGVNALLGRVPEALRWLAESLAAIERAPGWAVNYTMMLHTAANALWWVGRRDHAEAIERNLRQKTLTPDFRYPDADARLGLAQLCALQGRDDEAIRWFAEARRVLDEQGARPLRAITDFEEARMYARRAAPGDRERVLPLLDAAVRHFEAIGMPGWIRRAEALRHELGG
jgi:hypothetical protein